MVQKNFAPIKSLVQKSWSQKNVGPNNFSKKKIRLKKILTPKKNVGPKKIMVQKKLRSKNILVQKIFVREKNLVRKKFGPKNFG